MKILVLGGTRYVGIQLVNLLIQNNYDVTIATRGKTKDSFLNNVTRKIVDRSSFESLQSAFNNEHYDVVIDNIAYNASDVDNLLKCISTKRYILTSSVSAYEYPNETLKMNIKEEDLKYSSVNITKDKVSYAEGKRQAEVTLYRNYPNISKVMVRFPWIFGIDDYSKRLFYYVDSIINNIHMNIDNINEQLCFISSTDAAKFLFWCVNSNIEGPVNASSVGTITLKEIIAYTEKNTRKKAICSDDAKESPLNGSEGFSLDLSKAQKHGYTFEKIKDWLYKTIDYWTK